MGKLYGVNFVRCHVFKPVYPAKAGFLFGCLLLQKLGCGEIIVSKLLSGLLGVEILPSSGYRRLK